MSNGKQKGFDQKTDGFRDARLGKNGYPHYSNHSPANGFRSDRDEEDEEEELIEEDIVLSENQGSPLINAQTKQMAGKAKALFPSQNPPQFKSTESETFNLDTMTGFRGGHLPTQGSEFS